MAGVVEKRCASEKHVGGGIGRGKRGGRGRMCARDEYLDSLCGRSEEVARIHSFSLPPCAVFGDFEEVEELFLALCPLASHQCCHHERETVFSSRGNALDTRNVKTGKETHSLELESASQRRFGHSRDRRRPLQQSLSCQAAFCIQTQLAAR
eukprot:1653134-Rhodomonas_salina.1